MADNIVGNLFGVTPEMYQQSQADQARKQALQYAQLDPMQQSQFAMYSAGQNIPKAIGGLLGVEDPQLAMIRDITEMRKQFDVSSPKGLREYAQALAQKGYTDFAIQASQKAADIDKDIATAEKSRREPDAGLVQLIGKSTPESVAKFKLSGNIADLKLVKGANGEGGVGKPLPASLQKDEGKDLEAYDTYTAQKEALLPSITNLTPDEKGVRKLELGPLKNAKYMARNLAGKSTPESRAYEGLKSAVDTAVNLQVSAEKGVQTDKDVLRFANALIAAYGRNDTQSTLEALKRYNDALDKAQQRVAGRIESRRKSQNVEPYFQGQRVETPATAQPKKTVKFSDL